jgi:hypothetical protein
MLEIFAAAVFVMISRNDPITLEKQSALAVEQDGHLLMLACRPGKDEILINFIPRGYQGPQSVLSSTLSGVQSRFGVQDSPNSVHWDVGSDSLSYGAVKFGGVGAKAKFLDNLVQSEEFNLRYSILDGKSETITIQYELDPVKLKSFIALCNPKGVIKKLRDIKSQAAPDQTSVRT